MKKLLLSAATALLAVGGLYAACETPDTPDAVNTADVYDFKATVRTIANKKTTSSSADDCGTITTGLCCYRVTASRAFRGVFISCDCASFKPGTAFLYIGTSENRYGYIDDTINGDATYSWPILNIYGACSSSKSKYIQGLMSLSFMDTVGVSTVDSVDIPITKTYTLQAAGFGTQKNAKVYSMSGYITGQVTTAPCNCTAAFEAAFEPCTLADISTENNAVGGTFTLKYNSSLSKYAATYGGQTGLAVAQKVFGTSATYQTTVQ